MCHMFWTEKAQLLMKLTRRLCEFGFCCGHELSNPKRPSFISLYFGIPRGQASPSPTPFATVVSTASAPVMALYSAHSGSRASPTGSATVVAAALFVLVALVQESRASPENRLCDCCVGSRGTVLCNVRKPGFTITVLQNPRRPSFAVANRLCDCCIGSRGTVLRNPRRPSITNSLARVVSTPVAAVLLVSLVLDREDPASPRDSACSGTLMPLKKSSPRPAAPRTCTRCVFVV